MVEIIVLLILVVILFILLAVEIITGIRLRIMKRKNCASLKQRERFKRNTILLFTVMGAIGILILYSNLAARSPAIKDESGKQIEGSISELKKININGRKEWISIRGNDKKNPLLLFLAGGPGGTQMAAVRHELSKLEKSFVVIVWDQPGAGKSYNAGGEKLTVDTYIEDGLYLTDYLCKRFGQDKIYLVGESWGSALGVMLASESPERYHAVIGTGQMIDFLETEKRDYDEALKIAKLKNDTEKIKKLKKNGRPPYYGSSVTWKSAEYLNYLSSYMSSNPEIYNNGYQTFRDIFSPEYSIIDKINYLRGIVNTFNQVYPQLYDIDLREDYTQLEMPVYFFIGTHDLNAPSPLVEDYLSVLEAPHKKIIWFEHSGHSPWINESDKFVTELVTIKNLTLQDDGQSR